VAWLASRAREEDLGFPRFSACSVHGKMTDHQLHLTAYRRSLCQDTKLH